MKARNTSIASRLRRVGLRAILPLLFALTLQSAPGLASPAAWTDFSGQPTLVDDRFTVTAGPSDDARFFRLHRP